MKYTNMDSAQTIFFERELEAKKARTYDVIQAPLKAFELIPVSSEAGAGAESIVYEQYDSTGIAKIIANYADDLPRANVKGKEFVSKIKSVGNSYGYSIQEIRAAQFAGKSLSERQAVAAARAQREEWNRIAFYGDSEHGLQGWIGASNVPSATVVDGATNESEWDEKTNEEIVADVRSILNDIVDVTNGAEEPDTLVMPIKQYSKIATTRMADGTDTTILGFLKQAFPTVSFEWANELKGSFPGDSDGMIAYRRDPETMTLEMPVMFEQLEAQERGLEIIVPCHSRVGGVIVYYPMAQSQKYGI